MTKFENVGRRDGPGTGGKARKDVSLLPPARLASRPVHGFGRGGERHLYNILGASGITLADWIRKQRLERCGNDIAASAFHATPIASIARGWGFTDPSSFTRMFKNACGLSPREWRYHASTRRSEPTGEFINQ